MSLYLDTIRQCVAIPKPTFTEKDIPDQAGRVHIITGGYTGVGLELAKLLYEKNATIYLAGRTPSKGDTAITKLKSLFPNSAGRVEFLQLDLGDLTTIKASAEAFLAKEQRLDVLTNNAGVMTPPIGSKTTQGYELQMGTNCLGPWLFTHFLTPILLQTAASAPAGSVRVTWAASLATMGSPKNGITWDAATGAPTVFNDRMRDYAQTKATNVLMSREFAARFAAQGVVSNAWNPGNLMSELQRHQTGVEAFVTKRVVYDAKYGGYTELFAAVAPEAGLKENAGRYIGPWGRFCVLRKDIDTNTTDPAKFWAWAEKETKQYL